jgi:alkylation response protein AidB-like acyl-CoA dehydrogenase
MTTPADGAAEFILSSEQEELRTTLRRYLQKSFSRDELRVAIDLPGGYDPAAWTSISREIGVPAIVLPESAGGAGGTALELAVIAEEFGRALYCSPWFGSCVLALPALVAAGDAAAELIDSIAGGDATATLVADDLLSPGLDNRVTATGGGSAATLNGEAGFVVDGTTADHLLVLAEDADGGSLYLVSDRADVATQDLTTLDLTRRMAAIRFADTPARRIGAAGGAAQTRKQVELSAGLAVVAESLGGMQFCLEQVTEYATNRFQFGRAIGSFQAVKHKIANMLVQVEISRTAVQHATWICATDPDEAALALHLAKAQVGDSYLAVTADNIQTHGGIGFTYDHDAHLYFRRAKSAQLMFGSPDHHRDRLADLVGM